MSRFSNVLHAVKETAKSLNIPVERVLSDITTETLTCILCNRLGCDYEEWGDVVSEEIVEIREFMDIYDDVDTRIESAKKGMSLYMKMFSDERKSVKESLFL